MAALEPVFAIDPEIAPDACEEARRLFAGPCDFVKGVVSLAGLPGDTRPEVCFAGRSNVGKSSLINALTGRKGLARASNTPGRTQELNYFDLGGRGYLVDLPGYGYASAPKDKVAAWQALIQAYLAGRRNLERAFVLIDARHGIKAVDHEIMDLLDRAAVSFQVVLTKADKPGARALEENLVTIRTDLARHPTAYPAIRITAAQTGRGLPELRAEIGGLFGRHGP